MAVDLIYKHQQKTYDLMREQLKKSKKAAYEFPTGCGKSFPGLKYMEDNPEKTALIIVPSTHIKEQWEKNIERYVEGGSERLKNKNIVIVTYQKVSLLSKTVKNLKSDIIIIDELHRMGAETWEPAIDSLMERQPESEVIAMTATPKRTDKRNMAEEKFGECIVYEMSLTEALSGEKEGEVVLKSPRYVRVLSTLMPQIREYKERILDIEDEEKKQGLLKKYERLETIISRSPDIQDIMVAGMQKKNGKYIVFCKDREDMLEKMEQVQEIFGKVNSKINTEYVISRNGKEDEVGKTTAQNRKTLERFESAEQTEELQLLFCVDKLNEGVHIDGIDGEVLFDLTSSPVLYKQRIGRVTTPDKETVIVDAVNNWLTQIDTYREIEGAIKKGESTRNNTEADYSLLELSPEETELLDILREIGEEFKYNDNKTYEEIVKWLETHDGEMPRSKIKRNGILIKREEMTPEEKEETKLYHRWFNSQERKILEEYIGKSIEEVPEKYREKIKVLREHGLGLKEKTTYEQIAEWLKNHDGKMPRPLITRNGIRIKREEMTPEEKEEIKLYHRWRYIQERKILEEYIGRPIEEVPEEYREKISVLRGYGLGLKEKTTYEQIVEWLETHNGEMPSSNITRNGISIKQNEMTPEEKEMINLYQRWSYSQERKILDNYVGKPLEEVPEEYREKISVLREYGLGLKEKTTYEQIVEWLEAHDGELPKSKIKRNGILIKSEEMTTEEKETINLYRKWSYSQERKILEEYIEKPVEEVPEEYREKISVLRKYGLGLKEKSTYEQIVEWLEIHNGKMPNSEIKRNGIPIRRKEMTPEEQEETKLYHRWFNSQERKLLEEYIGKTLEEVPEEYREKIAKLRTLGQMGTKKDDKIKSRMKKSVGKQVGKNQETRQELESLKQVEEQLDLLN